MIFHTYESKDVTLSSGTKLSRYEIRSKLGEGGMGQVYLARDTSELDRTVAIKLLPAEVAADPKRMQRFIQEARTVSALNHPNVLTIYEFGQEGETRFIATECVEGVTVREHLRAHRVKLHEVLDIATQVAAALDAAHEAHVVHRDIKPDNIMVRRRDHIVKVLDFGLAKPVEILGAGVDTEAGTRMKVKTEPGVVMGTVAYMSPEQSEGSALIDHRTDIWSLGVVLYEMITGRLPFEGKDVHRQIIAIQDEAPAPLSRFAEGIPERLEEIVAKALAKDPNDRYQTAKDFLIDLRNLKRKLEIDAEIDRTLAPEARAAAATASGQSVPPTASQAETTVTQPTSSAQIILGEVKRHKRGVALVLAALVVAIAGFAYFFYVRSGKASINSVAVMPFVNAGNDPNAEYLSDGISESLINNLSQLPQLKVIARSSSFKYKGKEIDPEEVAKTLVVGAIVTGRVVQRGDELQISVELINALDKTQMWGEQYNRRAADLQAVQAEIARNVSEKLRLRLTGGQERQLEKRATVSPEAYQLYLNGLFYYRKGNVENSRKALDYYNQAVALDLKFALAYASMPAIYYQLTSSGDDPTELLAKGREAAQKALELDDSLAEAHSGLALIKQNEWDWSGAEKEFKRALELNPNLAEAHYRYARYLSPMGRTAEALAESKRAQELDPLLTRTKSTEAYILFDARRYDEAIQVYQNIIKMQPDYAVAHAYLGYAYAAKGQYAEAVAEYQKQISLDGETTSALCYLGYAYARSGRRDEALAILGKLKAAKEHVSPAELAALYAGLGDKEASLESLERAYREHDPQMQFLKTDPHYDALRSEARFQDLVRRVGLPQ
jgi:eukaryotic-like serine/threonine-protein kinase